jgi:UDPglucose--hexose-1-phosphate uridylyltransferase
VRTDVGETVPELRTDWLTGRAVIVAENRARRPNEFFADARRSGVVAGDAVAATTGVQQVADLTLAEAGLPAVAGVPSCPFCVGNESQTPRPVYEQLDQDGRWRVRVVANKYPAVLLEGVVTGGAGADQLSGAPPAATGAVGAHEVIIESARHVDRASALSECELRDVLEAYAARLRHWCSDPRLRYALVFKNQGPRAGASIAHVHSQLVGLPAVPSAVDAELRRAAEAYKHHQQCPYCRLVGLERTVRKRIVLDGDGYVAFCPFASLQPHEVWLLPSRHEPSFETASSETLDRLAAVMHALIERIETTVPGASYNMLLRTAPWKSGGDNWSHWRIEFIPRPNPIAGLEMATGLYINPLPPERASRELRPT